MRLFKFFSRFVALVGLVAIASAQSTVSSISTRSGNKLTYPEARRSEQVDDYHGTKVADPYRWLEDLDSAETASWVKAENKLTFDHLNQIPERAAIKARLTKLWNYERYGIPSKEGERYFYSKNDGLQNQSVLYTVNSLDAKEARVLLDPNKLSSAGTARASRPPSRSKRFPISGASSFVPLT